MRSASLNSSNNWRDAALFSGLSHDPDASSQAAQNETGAQNKRIDVETTSRPDLNRTGDASKHLAESTKFVR